MIQKKICLLGAHAVGKTSLIRRFVNSMFAESYQTTVGVKIDKKTVQLDEREINLILWDLHGDTKFQRVSKAYLRGMSGYLLVADGTRPETLETAATLASLAEEVVGDVPRILLLNKADLENEWCLNEDHLSAWDDTNTIKCSAKTGQGVEEAFANLSTAMMTLETSHA